MRRVFNQNIKYNLIKISSVLSVTYFMYQSVRIGRVNACLFVPTSFVYTGVQRRTARAYTWLSHHCVPFHKNRVHTILRVYVFAPVFSIASTIVNKVAEIKASRQSPHFIESLRSRYFPSRIPSGCSQLRLANIVHE